MRVIVGFDTECRCSEVSEGKHAEQRVVARAAKYLLTALPTDYFLLFQEVITENKKWICTQHENIRVCHQNTQVTNIEGMICHDHCLNEWRCITHS